MGGHRAPAGQPEQGGSHYAAYAEIVEPAFEQQTTADEHSAADAKQIAGPALLLVLPLELVREPIQLMLLTLRLLQGIVNQIW